jgi:hypothetical protein
VSQTQPTAGPSTKALIAAIVLAVLVLLVWAIMLQTLSTLGESDAAGNGMAEAFAGIEIVLLWFVLVVFLVVAGVCGSMPLPAAVAAMVLVPSSGIVAMYALGLLGHRGTPPFEWPLVTPALVPPIIVGFGFWTLLPPLRVAVPPWPATGTSWGAVLLLCVVMWPLWQIREHAEQHAAEAQAKWFEEFAAMPADAPLWEWQPFLQSSNEVNVDPVLERIRKVERRQGDAEVMLERGDFPLRYLGLLDLRPTQAICDKARALLRRQVQPLVLQTPNSKPYSEIANTVASALSAIQWLVGYGCPCDAEAQAWETMAKAYRDTNFDVVSLRDYRDPKELGWAVRQDPDQFDHMLPDAPLMAWVNVAEVPVLHERALANARRLADRTEQAAALLHQSPDIAVLLLKDLPNLDLNATPALCGAALPVVYDKLTSIERPAENDPRSYSVLLQQMGGDAPLTALQWLASHGCDANSALDEAQRLVRAFQDSPERAAMLAKLAQSRHTP